MSSCDNNVNINIKDLPQVFNITSGDYLIVENDQGTNIIDFKDIIISPEQTSFSTGLTSVQSDIATLSADLKVVSNAALPKPNTMNIRMSLSPSTPTPITSLTGANASTLYVHPYRGDAVTLYDTSLSAWQLYDFTSTVSESLVRICNVADTCYDIYLSRINNGFSVTSRPWVNSNAGTIDFLATTETKFIDGIAIHPTDSSKRLIGSLRTTNAGRSEYSFGNTAAVGVSGSHPKFFIWNMYNRQPEPFSILDNRGEDRGWTTTTVGQNASANGPFESFGGTLDNRVSFISREPVMLNLNSTYYVSGASLSSYYFAYSLNNSAPTTVSQLFANTPGVPILQEKANQAMTYSTSLRILPGYNFIQLVDMTFTGQIYTFLTYGGGRNSFGTIGTIQDI